MGTFTGGAPTENSKEIINKLGKDASLYTKLMGWIKAANVATHELQKASKVVSQTMSIAMGPLFSDNCN